MVIFRSVMVFRSRVIAFFFVCRFLVCDESVRDMGFGVCDFSGF